jgi:Sugar phosphate isomerases/epimerases
MMQNKLLHVANLWSLTDYPPNDEWPLEQKLDALKAAGFDGFTTNLTPQHSREAEKRGLVVVGYFSSSNKKKFGDLLKSQKDYGAHYINVQLGDHDTKPSEALRLAIRLMEDADQIGGLKAAIEVHRDTCTETPEKTYALADGYSRETGRLLPITWDFSHIAVVKHLAPENYIERLLIRPDLIQQAVQFHFRPFNGHHCQVPVTGPNGNLTAEVNHWLPFAAAVMRTWLDGNTKTDRTMIAVPEMGPVRGGYNLEYLPNSWDDAVRLRSLLEEIWRDHANAEGSA